MKPFTAFPVADPALVDEADVDTGRILLEFEATEPKQESNSRASGSPLPGHP